MATASRQLCLPTLVRPLARSWPLPHSKVIQLDTPWDPCWPQKALPAPSQQGCLARLTTSLPFYLKTAGPRGAHTHLSRVITHVCGSVLSCNTRGAQSTACCVRDGGPGGLSLSDTAGVCQCAMMLTGTSLCDPVCTPVCDRVHARRYNPEAGSSKGGSIPTTSYFPA